ncbi:Hypothetical protein ORPV_1022 [Orpheovirus IHUMI-LCC2]|uniref:Uncharacterized protein n=1 Tax=Orpheovirus IHUMI-LCC2 TaxID=2023057 RepID=A0A2I2L5Y3_9VIRU|nr:Hypothetical protein ORPV_1022 [Orpheovirus IHUMI-LCC2]SNW62926.1 Hypothetical protein ORPV_1022 [Orpheovirus IHUMI-LCC2]
MSDHNKTLSIVAVFLGLGSAGLSLYNLKTINSISANTTSMSEKITTCEKKIGDLNSMYVEMKNKNETISGDIKDHESNIKSLKTLSRDMNIKIDAIFEHMEKNGQKIELPKRSKKSKKKKKSKVYQSDSESESESESDSDSDSDSDNDNLIKQVNKMKTKRK